MAFIRKTLILMTVFNLLPFTLFAAEAKIRYVALGDSYTIGTGASPDQSWPALAARRLEAQGIPVQLVANLGRNGWTTQDLIDGELPVAEKLKPDFMTVLIGANDWVQGVDAARFQENLHKILKDVLKILPGPARLLVITIPDFSVTPAGKQLSQGRDVASGVSRFNEIIFREASSMGVSVLDLYPLSGQMGHDLALCAGDGLHPSPKGYAQWADFIGPKIKKMLTAG